MEAPGGQQQWMMTTKPQPQYAYGAPPPPSQPYHHSPSHEEICTLWIGDLPYWADEFYLHSWFAATNDVLRILNKTFHIQYPSVRGAKVVTDPNKGHSKGYGFVKFVDEMERNRAMSEMNGIYCSTRPMRISAATPKKTTAFQQQYVAPKGSVFVYLIYYFLLLIIL